MRYTLKNEGYPWSSICKGRSRVGRVWQHVGTKKFHGMIGRVESVADTKIDAFRAVVAKNLGHDTVQDLQRHNSQVRAQNQVARAQANRAVNDMLRGEFETIFQMIKGMD